MYPPKAIGTSQQSGKWDALQKTQQEHKMNQENEVKAIESRNENRDAELQNRYNELREKINNSNSSQDLQNIDLNSYVQSVLTKHKERDSESTQFALNSIQQIEEFKNKSDKIFNEIKKNPDELPKTTTPIQNNNPLKLGNGPLTLGNGPLTLGNGPLTLGNGPLTLGNGPLTLRYLQNNNSNTSSTTSFSP